MLTDRRAYATIPVADLDRAKQWYLEKLGFKPSVEDGGNVIYRSGGGTGFLIYKSNLAGQAPNTLMAFSSDDIRDDVRAMRERGVVFEEYDLPDLKTENGVAYVGSYLAAWFKDSEGNILAIGNEPV